MNEYTIKTELLNQIITFKGTKNLMWSISENKWNVLSYLCTLGDMVASTFI